MYEPCQGSLSLSASRALQAVPAGLLSDLSAYLREKCVFYRYHYAGIPTLYVWGLRRIMWARVVHPALEHIVVQGGCTLECLSTWKPRRYVAVLTDNVAYRLRLCREDEETA